MSSPRYCSSLHSSRSNNVKASAVAPAKPPITSPQPSLRTLRALDLMIVWPMETWPSPPTATRPPLRTVRMVVPCQGPDDPAGPPDSESCIRLEGLRLVHDLGLGPRQCKCGTQRLATRPKP